MPDKITNAFIAKICTVEFVISLLIITFGLGGSYISLSRDISDTQKETYSHTEKIQSVSKDIEEIKTSVAVIEANQLNSSNQAKEQKEELKEQREDIKKILTLIQKTKIVDE